jgi:hypothetical protein
VTPPPPGADAARPGRFASPPVCTVAVHACARVPFLLKCRRASCRPPPPQSLSIPLVSVCAYRDEPRTDTHAALLGSCVGLPRQANAAQVGGADAVRLSERGATGCGQGIGAEEVSRSSLVRQRPFGAGVHASARCRKAAGVGRRLAPPARGQRNIAEGVEMHRGEQAMELYEHAATPPRRHCRPPRPPPPAIRRTGAPPAAVARQSLPRQLSSRPLPSR